MKTKLLTSVILILFSLAFANPVDAQQECECGAILEKVIQKVEENYIGYALTKNEIGNEYAAHIKLYNDLAKNVSVTSCTPLLQQFLSFFKDGHLFVSEYPKYDANELDGFMSRVKEGMFDAKATYEYLLDNKSSLDNIEGLWTDGESKYAIIKNQNVGWKFDYVAVILSHAQQNKTGELKLGVSLKNGQLEGEYYTNTYSPSYTKVSVLKENSLLSIWGGRLWGRVAYKDESSFTSIKVFNPKTPVVSRLDSETALLSIPTFLVDKTEFDKVIDDNLELIKKSKYLVIDIRGNNGGNGIYLDLLNFFSDRSLTSEIGLALASEDNIVYFEKFGGPVYSPVVKAMKGNIGKIVDGPLYGTLKPKAVKSNIERVAIITDGANKSAAESFILHSKGVSSKVITIGKNTGGVIDYQSINMVKLGCEKQGIQFGYPTSTSTKEVPKKGYNKSGIAPDVPTEKQGQELLDFVKMTLKK